MERTTVSPVSVIPTWRCGSCSWTCSMMDGARRRPCLKSVCSVIGPVPKKMSKKRKLSDGSRRQVQPIALDSSGRPVFPIVLGGLTVYSLGEVELRFHWNLLLFVSLFINMVLFFRSSQTGCPSTTRAPSTQWASVARGCFPA